MKQCEFTAAASRDLDEIFSYFAAQSVEAGERFVEALIGRCQQLQQFPYSGRSYADLAPELRGLPVQGYIVLYRVTDTAVLVVRVISGYRDLEALFEGEEN